VEALTGTGAVFFVLWLQRVVLNRPIAAGFKFVFVFMGTMFLSWLTVKAALRVPRLDRII
jgi:glucan biosynthesis protein C